MSISVFYVAPKGLEDALDFKASLVLQEAACFFLLVIAINGILNWGESTVWHIEEIVNTILLQVEMGSSARHHLLARFELLGFVKSPVSGALSQQILNFVNIN